MLLSVRACLSELLRGHTSGHLCSDGGGGDVHPDPAQGRGEEHELGLGEGPDNPGGHGGGAGQHYDDVVIHVEMVENGDKDECAQVTHKVLSQLFHKHFLATFIPQ